MQGQSRSLIEQLVEDVAILIQNFDQQQPLQQQLRKHPLLQKLQLINKTSFDLPSPLTFKQNIAQRTLFDQSGLRISLYYIPKGVVMPLHNHPQMMVIAYLIYGSIKAKLFSPTSSKAIYEKQQMHLKQKQFNLIDGLRTKQLNLHEFLAIEDTLILDILFPDYDEQRDCCYYIEEQRVSQKQWKLKETKINDKLVQL